MKNKKILIGALAAVVVVGLAVAFGGNYFQGSLYGLKPIANKVTITNTKIPQVVNIPNQLIKTVLVVSKGVLADQNLVTMTDNNVVGSWTIANSSTKDIIVKKLTLQNSRPGAIYNFNLFGDSDVKITPVGYSSTPLGEVNFTNLNYTIPAGQTKKLMVKASVQYVVHDGVSVPQVGDKFSVKLKSIDSAVYGDGNVVTSSGISVDSSYGANFTVVDPK